MATIGARHNKLYVDFRVDGMRYREQTGILDTAENRRKAQQLVKRLDAEITLGTFDYLSYFPNGKQANKFRARKERIESGRASPMTFETFAEVWFAEKKVEWRASYQDITRVTLDKHIIPWFKERLLDEITKADILAFRAHLTELPGKGASKLSASRVNHILIPLRMILVEGADRFEYKNPWINIKRLKEKRPEVDPFSLQEVQAILDRVRTDFKAYYVTRFFTGLRSSEVDGLQWQYVDFERKQILVRQALVQGKMTDTKTDGSSREIDMCQMVFDALQAHRKASKGSKFVFSSRTGKPLSNRNVTQRVWYPLLRHLGLKKRRPYQTRHTAATLWLAAGENPEWIARQMGHANTKMLFEVYSRYVPNLTRKDGSAFEQLLKAEFK
jgi:integrase